MAISKMSTCLLILVLVGLAQAFPADWKIVNGTDAEPGEIPYIVSLRFNNRHTCGGSILDNQFILTAAHCVQGREFPDNFTIQYGTTQISQDDHHVIQVDKIKYHEEYNPNDPKLEYDIAILKLAEPIPEMEGLVRPTILPPAFNQTPGGQDAVLAGWGLPYTGGEVMLDLQRVDIIAYTDENCNAALGVLVNTELHICAGVPEGGKGQCSGDSGGPLTVNGVQVGIVSWSIKPCTRPGFPGVFTKVSMYIDWIKTNMEIMKQ